MFENMNKDDVLSITIDELNKMEENIRNDECFEIASAMFQKIYRNMQNILEYSDDDLLSFEVQNKLIDAYSRYKEMISLTTYRCRLINDCENVCGIMLTKNGNVIYSRYFDYLGENYVSNIIDDLGIITYEIDYYFDNKAKTFMIENNHYTFMVVKKHKTEHKYMIDSTFDCYENVKKYVKDMNNLNNEYSYSFYFVRI